MSQQPNLIGLSGKRGAGKDTFTELLNEALRHEGGHTYANLSFGDALKEAAQEITSLPSWHFCTQDGKAAQLPGFGMSGGEFLQKMGDGLRQAIGPNVWIQAAFVRMHPEQAYCNPSVRYPNEAQAIKARGGVMIRLVGNPVGQQGDGTRDDQHISEVALDDYLDFDIVVRNNGTLEELRLAALQVARTLHTGINPRLRLTIDAACRAMWADAKPAGIEPQPGYCNANV